MQKEIKDEEVELETETEKKEVLEDKSDNELALFKQRFEEIDDKYKRLYAEFDNYKKRTEKENIRTYENAKSNILLGFLPVLDSFEKAKESDSNDDSYKEGINLIFKQFEDYLKSLGVAEILTKGKKFDPEIHEAVTLVEDSGLESGMIVETFRKGYKLGDQVIRHSMVIVQK